MFTSKLINDIARLASSRDTYGRYGNRANPQLYKVVAEALNPDKGGIAVDVGCCKNMSPAEGLVAAGLEKVLRVDKFIHGREVDYQGHRNMQIRDRREMGMSVPGRVSDQIENVIGDATKLPIEDGASRLVVFNQSLYFVKEHAWKSNAAKTRTPSLLKENQQDQASWVVREALLEAQRVLEPNGWVLIKPGNHFRPLADARKEESALLQFQLKQIGFKDVTTIFDSTGKTPVFILARKAA